MLSIRQGEETCRRPDISDKKQHVRRVPYKLLASPQVALPAPAALGGLVVSLLKSAFGWWSQSLLDGGLAVLMDPVQLDAFEKLNFSPEEISLLARQNGFFLPAWPHSLPLHRWLSEQAEFKCLVTTGEARDEEIFDAIAEEQPHFVCPLSRTVFKKPVVWADGATYEESFLQKWLAKHDTSPLTRQQYSSKLVYPNMIISQMIADAIMAKKQARQASAGKVGSAATEL